MIKTARQLTLTAALIMAHYSHAAWYETTGQAIIEQGDLNKARQIAIDDALKRASLFAGVNFSSQQQFSNGILQQDNVSLSSQSEIRNVVIVSEQHQNNLLTITLQADIKPQPESCLALSYKNTLLLSEIRLNQRQDAIAGQLFNLGKDVSQRLEKHLRDYTPAAVVQQTDTFIAAEQLHYPATDKLFRQGIHYILQASITDLSLGEKTHRFWQKASKERFFAIDVMLFDVFEQHILFRQEYRTAADWPYKDSTPQSHSQAFWQMPYGQKIDTVLQAIADDTQQQLQCMPLLSSIVQVAQNQLQLNLGQNHGLKTGDRLDLIQLQRHSGAPQIKRLIANAVPLVITQTTQNTAWAKAADNQLLNHIQAGDMVSVSQKK